MSVSNFSSPTVENQLFNLNVPILGICYGMQAMTKALGGKVESTNIREFGHSTVRARGHSRLLSEISDYTNDKGHGLLEVWMSHGDLVTEIPEDFKIICSTENCPIAGIGNDERQLYGLQFHPEVTHTKKGINILERFITDICHCEKKWTTENIIEDLIEKVKSQVGQQKVLLALSGGVDSSVVAVILNVGDSPLHVGFRARDKGSLEGPRQEGTTPVLGATKTAAQHDIAGQVLVFRAEAVQHPRPH